MQIFDNITFHYSYIVWIQIKNISWYFDRKMRYAEKIFHDFEGNHDLISPNHGKHPSESSGIYWCIYPNPVSEQNSYFTSYKQQEFLLLLNLYLVLPSWYSIISALLLQHLAHQQSRFGSRNNSPTSAIYSLKSIHSHFTLSHTYIYRLGASLCYSATSSITGKSVRHLEWVRNSYYCIEVLPREVCS